MPPRYTTNTTEFPYNLWLYQKYYDIERIGWGLYPTHTWNNSEIRLPASVTALDVCSPVELGNDG